MDITFLNITVNDHGQITNVEAALLSPYGEVPVVHHIFLSG